MATKKPAKDDEKPNSGAGIWPLLRSIAIAMAVIGMVVLFVSAYDFGFIDLRYKMSMVTAPVIGITAVMAILAMFATAKCSAAQRQDLEDALQDMKVQAALRAENVEKKVEEYLGAEYNRLRTENEALQSSLEDVKKSEVEKLAEENKFLKELNEKLQSKINAATNGALPDDDEERTELVG